MPDTAPLLPIPEDPAEAHRVRLMNAMAACITAKGYAATTIADVVAAARVSKRTFYEHFADKEACFLALYSATTERTLDVIVAAAAADLPWEQRLEAAARAYLTGLAARPEITRTNLIEIQAAGPRALAARRHVIESFADLLRGLADEARDEVPSLRALSPEMATALAGGMHELMLRAVEQGRVHELAELGGTATELIRSVLVAPPR
jgi:AcrR family transcriptional regulator